MYIKKEFLQNWGLETTAGQTCQRPTTSASSAPISRGTTPCCIHQASGLMYMFTMRTLSSDHCSRQWIPWWSASCGGPGDVVFKMCLSLSCKFKETPMLQGRR